MTAVISQADDNNWWSVVPSQPDVVVDSLPLPSSCYEQLHASGTGMYAVWFVLMHWNAAIGGNPGEWGGTAASIQSEHRSPIAIT